MKKQPSSPSDEPLPEGSAWAWDVYWHADRLHSCVPVSNPEAAKSLSDRWRAFFEGLPKKATIVDVGTGNGAVISIAARLNDESDRAFSLHGVDAAAIDPASHVKSASDALSQVTFHPATKMEALPFADGSVDAVSGQYALEYAPLDAALAEIVRVLTPGGAFRFLIHARDSVLIERSRLQRHQIETILESGIIDIFRDTLSLVIDAEKATSRQMETLARARTAFQNFNSRFGDLQARFQKDAEHSVPANFLGGLARLFQLRKRYAIGTTLSLLDDMTTRLRAQALRLCDLDAAALDAGGIAQLADRLSHLGASIEAPEKARSDKENMSLGWWLSGNIPD